MAKNVLVKSVLLYGAETRTILKYDEQTLEAFHMSCQRRILGIRRYDFVTNGEVVDRTHQESLVTQVQIKYSLGVQGVKLLNIL